jgi:hypothetical protein
MSDTFYFACLFGTVLCAVACAWLYRRLIGAAPGEAQGVSALGIGVSSAVGFLASLPFQRTQEMPWWPYVAGGYFFVCVVATILMSNKRGQRRAG